MRRVREVRRGTKGIPAGQMSSLGHGIMSQNFSLSLYVSTGHGVHNSYEDSPSGLYLIC